MSNPSFKTGLKISPTVSSLLEIFFIVKFFGSKPFFTSLHFNGADTVSRMLGIPEEQLTVGSRERGLISCTTKDGVVVFPGFQFMKKEGADKPVVVDGFSEIVSVFVRSSINDWTLAGWMVKPQEDLEKESIIGYLKAGKGIEKPLALARNLAERISNPPVV